MSRDALYAPYMQLPEPIEVFCPPSYNVSALSKKQRDPELEEALATVSDILQTAEKVLRSYRIYAAGHVTVAQFEAKLFEKMSAFLDKQGEMSLAVKPFEFLYAGEVVYNNTDKQENFSFKFHQDGIRQLTFLQGISQEELKNFNQILRTDYESYEFCDDDVVTLLWKNSFEHISYIVVETFVEAGAESENLEVTLGKMANDLMEDRSFPSISSLTAGKVPSVRRKLKKADAQEIMSLPDLVMDSTNDGGQDTARQTESQLSADDLAIVHRMILVLLRVLIGEERKKEFQSVSHVVRRMAESMVRIGNFALASKLYSKIRDLADPSKNPSGKNAQLMKLFYEELNDKAIMESVEKAALSPSFSKYDELAMFISSLLPRSSIFMFGLFKNIENPENRTKVIPSLASIGADHADAFSSVFSSGSPGLALSVLDLLGAVGVSKTSGQIKRAFHHKDPHVRSRSLDLLAQEGAEHAKALCLSAMKDGHSIVRMKALKLLVETRDKKLAKPVYEITRDPIFEGLDLEEKKQVYVGLARLGGPLLIKVFKEDLKGGMLERSEKEVERRIAAVFALSSIGTSEARAVVEEERDRKLVPKSVKEACESAVKRWPKEQKHAG